MPEPAFDIYETVYGSRLFGTDIESSDYDYKKIVLPALEELILGARYPNEVLEGRQMEIIPLQNLMLDFYQGQTYAMELVAAVNLVETESARYHKIHNPVLFADLVEVGKDLRTKWVNRNTRVMAGYAKGQALRYANSSRRFQAVERFDALLNQHDWLPSLPDTEEFKALCAEYADIVRVGTYDTTPDLGRFKPCIHLLDKIIPLSRDMSLAKAVTTGLLKTFGQRVRAASNLNSQDWKAIGHAIRIAQAGVHLLTKGEYLFPFQIGEKYCNELRAIRQGKYTIEYCTGLMDKLLFELEELEEKSTLPDAGDHERLKEFRRWRQDTMKWVYHIL